MVIIINTENTNLDEARDSLEYQWLDSLVNKQSKTTAEIAKVFGKTYQTTRKMMQKHNIKPVKDTPYKKTLPIWKKAGLSYYQYISLRELGIALCVSCYTDYKYEDSVNAKMCQKCHDACRKTCKDCFKTKPSSEFPLRKTVRDGLLSSCKLCLKETYKYDRK